MAANPAPQPRPAAPSPTGNPLPRALGNKPRIMMNVANVDAAPKQAPVPTQPKRNEVFTAEQLQEAWQEYMDQHPQEKALLATMSYARPQPEGNSSEHYVVIVASPTEQKNVEEHKEALMQFLCDVLKNDHLTIDVKLSDVPMDTPKILSPREVVEQIKQHNPNFTQFLKDFDLGLA